MLPAAPGALVMAVITALVIAPAFTLIGGLLTWLFLFTVYPVLLLVGYCAVGWSAAAWLRTEAEAEPLPRWRTTLALGVGAGLTMTLVLVVTALALGAALGGWFAYMGASAEPSDAFNSLFDMALRFTIRYAIAGLTLGTLCAWLGAWVALRRPPPGGRPPAPGAPRS
jgi:hypothetical protein